MAQSRHAQCADECPLLGARRTLTQRCLPISIYGVAEFVSLFVARHPAALKFPRYGAERGGIRTHNAYNAFSPCAVIDQGAKGEGPFGDVHLFTVNCKFSASSARRATLTAAPPRRSSCRSGPTVATQNRQGVQDTVAELVLGHVQRGVQAVYDRHSISKRRPRR